MSWIIDDDEVSIRVGNTVFSQQELVTLLREIVDERLNHTVTSEASQYLKKYPSLRRELSILSLDPSIDNPYQVVSRTITSLTHRLYQQVPPPTPSTACALDYLRRITSTSLDICMFVGWCVKKMVNLRQKTPSWYPLPLMLEADLVPLQQLDEIDTSLILQYLETRRLIYLRLLLAILYSLQKVQRSVTSLSDSILWDQHQHSEWITSWSKCQNKDEVETLQQSPLFLLIVSIADTII
jgi:hypothetical protein